MQDIFLFMQHQQLLVTALIVVLILIIILEFLRQKRGGRGISPQAATKMINHQNAVILDIRTPDAFASGHIVGAVSMPATELAAKIKKIEKYKSQPIVITCGEGTSAYRTVQDLQKQGFNVSYLAGGIRAWREADLPLVKGA